MSNNHMIAIYAIIPQANRLKSSISSPVGCVINISIAGEQ